MLQAGLNQAEPGPGAVRPDPEPLKQRLERIVSNGAGSAFAVPGAVFAVVSPDGGSTIEAMGVDANGGPVHAGSLFPLTSASKLATGLMVLKLVDAGELGLDRPIGFYLPDAAVAAGEGVTVRRLLAHTSGLPLEVPHDLSSPPGALRYGPGLQWPGALAEACLGARPTIVPGSAVQYSNVGYGLLGLAAERITGQAFARLLSRLVFEPLGIEAYVGELPAEPPMAIADVQTPHAGTALEAVNSEVWRLLGTPWAGVTTNASGLLALVRAYTPAAGFLSLESAEAALTDQAPGLSGGFASTEAFIGHHPSRSITWSPAPWGLAVELQGGKEPHWAPASMPDSFGQIGSSGCIAWCDPGSGVAWAFMGAKGTESGWLLRHGGRIAQAAIAAANAAR